MNRFIFASRYARRHLLLSVLVGCLSAATVFGLLYPPPFQHMLGVSQVFVLLLAVDVVCGPLLTLVLASPRKSRQALWIDWSLIGTVQIIALLYGLHAVWIARPAVLAFEVDRLMVATANEVQIQDLSQAPQGMRSLPWWGLMPVHTRAPKDANETFEALELGMAGISPAMRPSWWLPWKKAQSAMAQRMQPVIGLLQRRPQEAVRLQVAIQKTKLPLDQLYYLPLTSSKTRDYVILLDSELNQVGWAEVDGF